jgi:hypothetical protein
MGNVVKMRHGFTYLRKKSNLRAVLFGLLVAIVGSGLQISAAEGSESEEQLQPIDDEKRKKYAAGLISRQICSELRNDHLSSEAACTPISAGEPVPVSVTSNRMASHQLAGKFDSVRLAGYVSSTETNAALGMAPVGARLIPQTTKKSTSHRRTYSAIQSLSSEEYRSASMRSDAVPGALLVTILALVGIVAVARRDAFGRPSDFTVSADWTRETTRISTLGSMRTQ